MFILIVSVCKSTTRVIFTNSEFSADCLAIAGVVRKLNWTNVVIVYDSETGESFVVVVVVVMCGGFLWGFLWGF